MVMIGIVIVSYKSDERTKRFVREELPMIGLPHRTVVVDVGGTLSEIEGADLLHVENKGFAYACNEGARYLRDNCAPTRILFCNNDLHIVSPNVIAVLDATLTRHPEAGAVGPEILGPDGHRQGPAHYMGMWKRFVWMYLSTPFLSRRRKRKIFHIYEGDSAPEGVYDFISAAFMLADAESFFKAGMFDENTFLYAEENILSDRMRIIGKCFRFDPSVSIFHEKGATVNAFYGKREQSLLQMRSLVYYYREYRAYSLLSCRLASFFHRIILHFI